MKRAKTEYSARLTLVHKKRLYVWSQKQLDALNYYRHHKVLTYTYNWQDESKIVTVQRNYTKINTQPAIIISSAPLGEYRIAILLFADKAEQIWLTDQDLEPICNITSWT